MRRSPVLEMSLACVLLTAWLAVGGCGDKVGAPGEPPPVELSTAARQLVEADNTFGLKLFREIVKAEADTSVFISPLSVSMALGMTFNGARGTTEGAMRKVLEYGDLTGDEINQSYRDIIDLLGGLDPDVEFAIANSIWHREDVAFKRDFLDVNRRYFDAEVRGLDFFSPDAARTINAWVSEKTNGRIEKIVSDPIDPSLIMFLINAIYFKGTWTYEFDPDDTRDAVFHLPDGSERPCRMMEMEDTLRYQATETFQAVDLPYGDGAFSTVVMLPRHDTDVDALVGMLTPENWESWLQGFSVRLIYLGLPKFTLEYGVSLKDILTSLGMGIAFDPEAANLTGLYEGFEKAYISEVKHKTFVQVDEEGTEAAGVTEVGLGRTSAPPSMVVNRPFVFAIRESHSNTILFIGKIVEPLTE